MMIKINVFIRLLLLLCIAACPLWDIQYQFTGSSQITLDNGEEISEYTGTIVTLYFYTDNNCSLNLRDEFISGEESLKEYSGTYEYEENKQILTFILTLQSIDGEATTADTRYLLTGTNNFNLETVNGTLHASIIGGNLPAAVTVEVELSVVNTTFAES